MITNSIKATIEEPLVTIGVSSFNYSRFIDNSLNSLLTQTYKNTEIIIIDDCSSDDCPQKIEAWIKRNNVTCTYIRHIKNLGITKTTNEIVRLAKGKYITFLATDDIMMPERITRQVSLLEEAGEDFGLSYSDVQLIDEDDNVLGSDFFRPEAVRRVIKDGDVLKEYAEAQFRFTTPSMLVRKSVYDKVGLYNEKVMIEDYDFFIRLFAVYKVKYCAYPTIKYRVKKQSTIHEKMTDNNSELYCRDRIYSNHEAMPFIKDKKIKLYLKNKISFYLQTMANAKSKYFPQMFFYLLVRGYFGITAKTFLIKLRNMVLPGYKKSAA